MRFFDPEPGATTAGSAAELAREVAEGASTSFGFLDMPAPWVVVLVVLPVFLAVAFGTYWREPIGRGAKFLLGGLRFASFTLLFLVLARPVQVESREEVFPAEVLVLVDDSASMRRQDAYTGDASTRQALARLAGGAPDERTRLELLEAAISTELVPRLERGEYRPRWLRFDQGIHAWDPSERLEGRGQGTHVGDALVAGLAQMRGRHLTDVVVLSDGRSTGGIDLYEAARAASAAGVPVHTVVVGDTRPERNAVLELIDAPSAALEGDELSFAVRATGRGSAVGERVEVLLEELAGGREEAGRARVLDSREVRLDADGRRIVLVAPPGPADARTGERRFRLHLPPIQDETLLDDNTVEVTVRVSPEKVRVLYVEGYPRYEYRRLALETLKRAETDVSFHAWLVSANPGFPQEHSRGLAPLDTVPSTRRELLDRYDVIVLGDFDPAALYPDPDQGLVFLTAVREFVEAGGGLLLIAGEYYNPRALIGTPLEDVLPVVIEPATDLVFEGDRRRAFRPRLESPAAPHEIVRLHPDPDTNRRLIEEEGGLAGQFWYLPVSRAKPGAEVLLVHPSDTTRHGPRPLLVLGYFPQGRTLFTAMDETWRWQFLFGPRYFERFWKGSLRWLALSRLRGGDRRYRLESTRASFDIAERAVLEARVLDEDYRPSAEASQTVLWSGPEGSEGQAELIAVGERGGLFRGSLELDRPGQYRVFMEREGRRVATADFEVLLPSREMADPAPDPAALAELSAATGGLALELARIADLARVLPGGEERREPISSRLEDLWDRWITLLLALVILSAEWIARKRLELV